MRADLWITYIFGCFLSVGAATDSIAASTDPTSATVGTAEIVLPGFAPVSVTGRRVELGSGRAYEWGTGLLPTQIQSRGTELAGPMAIVISEAGVSSRVTADTFTVTASTPHHVELTTTGTFEGHLSVEARIRIEYDGLAIVDLLLTPRGPIHIDGMELVAPIARTRDMRVLAFEPETIYEFQKQEVFPLCRDMPYKSAVGLTDTDRSFWLLTDEPAVPLGVPRWRTRLACDGDRAQLRQPLLPDLDLSAPLTLRFAFMATPVRDLPGTFRQDRALFGLSADEARLGNRQLWWVQAFPHYALPFTDYPPGARERLDAADLAAYPGLAANQQSIEAWRELGIERLPYMTLRAPSGLDPVVSDNLTAWRVLPPRTYQGGDGPYRQGFERPTLSLRAQDFSDYWLFRLDQVLAKLPARGFYFDQAEPTGSANPAQLPTDLRIRPAMATDILAIRAFFKRLATAIYQRGRAPLIYVHNSMATIVPAYSFVTGMIQGEEFNLLLQDLNYQKSTDLEFLQTTYTSGAFGIPVIWLEEVWSDYLARQRPPRYQSDSAGWVRSPEYDVLWRNFMSLALLHDVPVWTHAPAPTRQKLFYQLDRFGIGQSVFTGYWKLDSAWRSRTILASLYTRGDGRVMAVIVNRGDVSRVLTTDDLAPFVSSPAAPAGRRLDAAKFGAVGQTVKAGDFLLSVVDD